MENFTKTLKNYFAGQGLTQSEVAERLQISRTVATNYLNGNKPFGRKAAMKWATAFGLDEVWLMTQGEQGNAPNAAAAPAMADADIINVPILSPDAKGGFGGNDCVDIAQYTIGTMPFPRSIAHAGDIVIAVYNDSMSPRYPAGSHILIRPIEAWREYIELGRTYVLELLDWRRLIKIVRRGSDSDHYTLDSYNIDYQSDEVAKDFIRHMWLVVASVNREEL